MYNYYSVAVTWYFMKMYNTAGIQPHFIVKITLKKLSDVSTLTYRCVPVG